MPDEKVAESSPADTFYKPEAESAPAKQEEQPPAAKSESAPDKTKSDEESSSETASGSEPEKDKEPRSPKAEGRIKQLIARQKELERELADLKRVPPPKTEKLTAPEMPDPNKYETLEALRAADAEYYRKQSAYEIQQAIERDRKERAQEVEQAKIQELNAHIERIWIKREASTEKRHADYKDVVYNEEGRVAIVLNRAADGFILDSEIGPELLYYLAKHPDDAEALREMSPYQTARELTKLEERLETTLKVPKKISDAPPPPRDVGGRGVVANAPRPLEEVFYGKQ